jgi:nucleoside-diphosphate-sugar epimerase
MTRRVLLTGGAGFVGSNLARVCLREGWQVGVLYLPDAGLSMIRDILPKIQAYPIDGTTASIFKAVEDFKPNLVFHLASIFLAKHTPADIPALIQANVTFGTQVLDAMSESGAAYMVNTGTSWQHFEDAGYNPVNLYAATKQAFDDILGFYVQSGHIKAITLKLFDTYGPGDPRPKLFHLFEKTAREGSRLEMSPGEQWLDIVYIDDVVNAFILAAKRLFNGEVKQHESYAVSSGHPIRLRDLAERYQETTGQKLDIVWGGRPYREREVMRPWSKGAPLPGWQPRISLENGIRKRMREKK